MFCFPKEIVEKYQAQKPAYMRVYNIIRDTVLSGQITPDTKITEEKTAELLGLSRTPVRTALTKLIADGILPDPHMKGSNVNIRKINDVLFLLGVLEAGCVSAAARRKGREKQFEEIQNLIDEMTGFCLRFSMEITPETADLSKELERSYHLAVCRLSGNDIMIDRICELWDIVLSFPLCSGEHSDGHILLNYLQSTALLRSLLMSALMDRDPNSAETYMKCIFSAFSELYLRDMND